MSQQLLSSGMMWQGKQDGSERNAHTLNKQQCQNILHPFNLHTKQVGFRFVAVTPTHKFDLSVKVPNCRF